VNGTDILGASFGIRAPCLQTTDTLAGRWGNSFPVLSVPSSPPSAEPPAINRRASLTAAFQTIFNAWDARRRRFPPSFGTWATSIVASTSAPSACSDPPFSYLAICSAVRGTVPLTSQRKLRNSGSFSRWPFVAFFGSVPCSSTQLTANDRS